MEDDPYLEVIDKQRANIVLLYQLFKGKDQIILYDIGEDKIYSYPAEEYIQNLSERTRDYTAQQFAEATTRNQFLLFIKDTKNNRLRSYVLDLSE